MDIADRSQAPRAGAVTPRDEETCLRCGLSKSFLEAGDYERARESLSSLWRRAGERPDTEGLGARAAAELLLQAGRLTGAIGDARRLDGAQEAAKNLLSEAATAFERLGKAKKVAEAQGELGLCYWREGAYDEARVVLRAALDKLSREDGDQRAVVLMRLSVVEFSTKRYEEGLRLNDEAAPLVEASTSDALKGCFHNHRALTYKTLAESDGETGLGDRSLVEYAAASYHFERAGHTRYQAHTENNLANLLKNLGRHAEAHDHLDRAHTLFVLLKDTGGTAQCNDTRARVLIAEGRFDEAAKAARAAVRSLEESDRRALYAESLATLGLAQARAGRHAEARRNLLLATSTAEAAGDRTGAGQAALVLLEELCAHMTAREMGEAFERAHDLLSDSPSPDTLARLMACARRVVSAASSTRAPLPEGSPEQRWAGFSLKSEVLRYEAELIGLALRDADGLVSRAAKLLGFKHHQTFVALLNNRHKSMQHVRNPIIPRRRSITRLREPHRREQKPGDQ
ncbi:MAG: hypothetical protein QOE46_2333 [Acidobacteriota bacterium]|jgi:tetratricopeptide (TPR) repeat protein|nr:hypothetical protein [Acidobacteriota bacterium]